ncbi:AMY1.1 [Symbiodinium sp. CCMP2592]|nr:AMY1.1 [Symbiodinium sp. CCMP2592]
MSDGRWLTKSQFHRFTVAPLNRWFKLWRQPDQSLLRWQVFVSHQWQLHSQTLRMRLDGRQLRELKNLRESSEHIVISPIDHGPHLAYAFCPQQYFDILTKTFLDPAVFWRRDTNPMQLSEHIQRAIKRHVPTRYHWALAPKESLPYAYVLPKPSKQFLKGRPIVSYSNTWCATLAKFLSTAVLQMLQTVVPPQFVSPTVHSIIQTFIHAFRNNPVTVELQLLQQDLSGFFPSVPHDRIYHSISSLTDMFARHQQIPLDSDIQITMRDRNSLGRLFRGRYRKAGSHYKPLCLRDLPSLVMFLLRHSFFTVGTEILVQHRGASMGSPMAPSMCGATAALWEATFHQLIRDQMLTSRYFCSSRYVDNRCLLRIWDGELESLDDCQRHHSHRGHDPLSSSSTSSYGWFQEVYLHPHFYGLPLELEHVPGQELLGTVVDTAQRTLRDLPRGFISFADYPGPKPSLHLKFVNLFIYIVNEVSLNAHWKTHPGPYVVVLDYVGDRSVNPRKTCSHAFIELNTTQQTPSTTSPPYYLLFFHIISTFQGHVNIIFDIFIVFILFFVPHYGTTNSGPTYLLVPFEETSTEDTFGDQHYHSSDRSYTSHYESSLSNIGRAELH